MPSRPDPLIYRFYELVMVKGPAWKALIEEEYGDGIIGDRFRHGDGAPAEPKGDRVKITMSGKFLPTNIRRQRQRAGIWVQGRLKNLAYARGEIGRLCQVEAETSTRRGQSYPRAQ